MSTPVEPTKPTITPQVQTISPDKTIAIELLDKLDVASAKLGFDEHGNHKPGTNISFYKQRVTIPLRKAVESPKTDLKVLIEQIKKLSPEEPSVKKFFVNPIKS